jgi:hypothetical protein
MQRIKLTGRADIPKRKSKKSKLFTMENHQTTMINNKRGRKEQRMCKIIRTKNRMTGISYYPINNTLSASGLNSSIRRHIFLN